MAKMKREYYETVAQLHYLEVIDIPGSKTVHER